jgi:hypothetical protein
MSDLISPFSVFIDVSKTEALKNLTSNNTMNDAIVDAMNENL